jgi:hypothetical protein
MSQQTATFQKEFEKLLSRDFLMLDNVSEITWKDGDPGCFLMVLSPKTEETFDDIKEHAVIVIRNIAKELRFKAKAQELVVNGVRSAIFKITPEKPKD